MTTSIHSIAGLLALLAMVIEKPMSGQRVRRVTRSFIVFDTSLCWLRSHSLPVDLTVDLKLWLANDDASSVDVPEFSAV